MKAARGRVCVIGGGSSGLTAARNLLECDFDVEIFEAQPDLGGLWNASTPACRVYESVSMISSKPFTQFPDFPMPAAFPDYPSHRDVLQYLRDYAAAFGLDKLVTFGRRVDLVERNAQTGRWQVSVAGERRDYDAVIVASGHNWSPRSPEYQGSFGGLLFHSADYRTPALFAGKRVLVVGRGNSGCEIAVEAADFADRVVSSGRRGYHFIPKYLGGRPADQLGDELLAMNVPLALRRQLTRQAIVAEVGDPSACGLPAPDHELFETHPVVNSRFPAAVRDGTIVARPDVRRFDDDVVHFADGTSESFDIVVFATGYKIDLPFLNCDAAFGHSAADYHLNVFHPNHDDLFFAGFIQPDSGQFGLVHWQMRAVALYLRGLKASSDAAIRLRERKTNRRPSASGGIRYLPVPRHILEVEHWSYLRELRSLISVLEA